MQYLSKDDLLDLHVFVVTRYGGRLGVASDDRLQNALAAPAQYMFGTELYYDLPSKAAVLMFMLLKNRPFLNANQGTALLAALRFLDLNQAALGEDIAADDLLRVTNAVDRSEMTKDQLEAWFRQHIV